MPENNTKPTQEIVPEINLWKDLPRVQVGLSPANTFVKLNDFVIPKNWIEDVDISKSAMSLPTITITIVAADVSMIAKEDLYPYED